MSAARAGSARPLPSRLMRIVFLCALLIGLGLAAPAARAAQQQAPAQPGSVGAAPKESPEHMLKRQYSELTTKAGLKVGSFAAYADEKLEKLAHSRGLAWGLLVAAVVIGLVCMLYGWTLIQSLLIPLAPVWGVMTGGVTAFCIIEAFYTGSDKWFRVVLLTVGVALGLALYLFSALRAKPVAAFLVVVSPFLILAMPLFGLPQTQVVGIILFCAGLLAGFAAMVEVRPLAIVSTSVFGAGCMLGAWGTLGHLLGKNFAFAVDSFTWLISQPLMLVIAWAVIAFVGISYQFTTGPKGTLAD